MRSVMSTKHLLNVFELLQIFKYLKLQIDPCLFKVICFIKVSSNKHYARENNIVHVFVISCYSSWCQIMLTICSLKFCSRF